MSSLELDEDIINECDQGHVVLTSTTGTPGSLDSSRSLWELGTFDADEDEILSLGVVTPRPIISSIRMQSLNTDIEDKKMSDLDSLTQGIDSLLQSIPSLSGKGRDLSRLCLGSRDAPLPVSNRMCIENVPRIDFSMVWDMFDSIKQQVGSLGARLIEAQFAQPESVSNVLESLEVREEGIIPSSSVPVLNRRQRRAMEQKRI
jgi:hypothetical protein